MYSAEIVDLIIKAKEIKEGISGLIHNTNVGEAFAELQDGLMNSSVVEILGRLLAEHFRIEYIGSGCTRIAYRIDNYVLKLDVGADSSEIRQHTNEIKAILYANKKQLKYSPKLFYFDEECTITEYIPIACDTNKYFNEELNYLEKAGFIVRDQDVNIPINWRLREDYSYCLIDWGLVEFDKSIINEVEKIYKEYLSKTQIIGF